MEWWDWLVIGGAATVFLVVASIRLVRKTARGRTVLKLSFQEKLRFGRALLHDPQIPLLARGLVAVLVAYLALPLDLIPDFVPIVGQLDDFLIVALVLVLLLRVVPGERLDAAIAAAREGSIPPAYRLASPVRRA